MRALKPGPDHHPHHFTDEILGLTVFAHVEVNLDVEIAVAIFSQSGRKEAGDAQRAGGFIVDPLAQRAADLLFVAGVVVPSALALRGAR